MSTSGKPGLFARRFRFGQAAFITAVILIPALLGLFHLLGWRDDTAIISGTSISPDTTATALRGVLYGLTYVLTVTVSPIILLAAGIHLMLGRVGKLRRESR